MKVPDMQALVRFAERARVGFVVAAFGVSAFATRALAQVPPSEPVPKPAQLVARVLTDDGAPVAELDINLRGQRIRADHGVATFQPESFETDTVSTDSDGRFELSFDPPRNFQFTLTITVPGHVGTIWRWQNLARGERRDLGDVVLRRGGTIEGRILGAGGRPVTDRWTVYAEPARGERLDGGEPVRPQTLSDPNTGAFTLADLPPGTANVRAYSRLGDWIDVTPVEVAAGETARIELLYAGPDTSQRISVSVSAQPFFSFVNEIDAVELSSPGMETRVAVRDPRSPQRFVFDDVPPGEYTVEVRDDVFRTWRQSNVAPGSALSAQLMGSGAVRLRVVDAATRAPVTSYGLRVRLAAANSNPSAYDVRRRGTEAPESGLVEGLLPRKQSLIVLADGYAPAEAELADFTSVPELEIALFPGVTLAGRVVFAPVSTLAAPNSAAQPNGAPNSPVPNKAAPNNGAPNHGAPNNTAQPNDAPNSATQSTTPAAGVPGVELRLSNKSELGGSIWSLWTDDRIQRTRTGADGSFTFTGLGPATYELVAQHSFLVRARSEIVVREGAPSPQTCELALPHTGSIAGHVRAGEALDFDGMILAVLPVSPAPGVFEAWQSALSFGEPPAGFALAPDGAFDIANVPAGVSRIELVLPMRDPSDTGGVYEPRARIPLGTITVNAGAPTRQDLDAKAVAPVLVRAVVLVNGEPAPGVLVQLVVAGRQPPVVANVRTDENGLGFSTPFLAKEVRCLLRAPGDAWTWMAPDVVTLAPGELTALTWDVQVVAASARFVDAEQTPLARRALTLLPAEHDGTAAPVIARTDAVGRARLSLVPARYRASLVALPGVTRGEVWNAEFEWTTSGAEPSVIVVTPVGK